MGRRTTGSLITRGKARNCCLRWQHDGKVRVMRLSDQDGKPITRCLEAEWAAEHLMALCRGHPGDTRRRHRPRGHDDALAGHLGAESRALAFAPSAWSHRDIPEFESGSLFSRENPPRELFFWGTLHKF